jgi:hypothetical protein
MLVAFVQQHRLGVVSTVCANGAPEAELVNLR